MMGCMPATEADPVEGLDSAGLDVGGLDNAGLTERFRSLELQARRVEAEMAAMIAEGQRRGVYGDDCHLSMKGWLKANANWSNSQTFRRRRVARLIEAFPQVGDMLRDGHIGVAQTEELARVHANPRVVEQFTMSIGVLLNLCEQLSFEDAQVCLKRWETLADLNGAHNDREMSRTARTATVTELDGALFLKASGGSAEDAAEIVAIFDAAVEAEFQTDVAERARLHGSDAPASLLPRSDAQRRFDAMQTIFRKSVSVPDGATPPKPLVNIIIDQRSFEDALFAHGYGPNPDDLTELDLSQRHCETSTGIAVLPDVALRAALIGHVRRVVIDSAGVVVNMGRKQRLFTGSAREAAKLMAHRCGFAGCDIPATYAEVDHLDEWGRDDGNTDQDNAGINCKTHNRAKHRGFRAERQPNGQIVFYKPDGTAMGPIGRRPPPETDDQHMARRLRERLNALNNYHLTGNLDPPT